MQLLWLGYPAAPAQSGGTQEEQPVRQSQVAARLRGVRSKVIDQVDLVELGAVVEGEVVVEFTHPLCTDCRELERSLRHEGRAVLTIDVSKQPHLARKYGVTVVPTAVLVGPDGAVRARIA